MRKGFTCKKCGYGCGYDAIVNPIYDKEIEKPFEECEEKVIQAALQDSRYDRFNVTENGKPTIDLEKLEEEDELLYEELWSGDDYIRLGDLLSDYECDESSFAEAHGTCPGCGTKGTLRLTG